MKIPDYKVGTSFEITCTKEWHPEQKRHFYKNFQISKEHASIWGRKPEDVITVKMTIIENDLLIHDVFNRKGYDENCVDYFGRIDFEDGLDIGCFQSNIKLYIMCFPYGPDSGIYWKNDIKDPQTQKIRHHAGDRKSMNVRLKIDEI